MSEHTETHYQDATGWHRKHDVHGGPHDEPPSEMTPIIDLYVRCSYPLRSDAIAASDTCRHPANTAVRDAEGNLWWRCPTHEGELRNGVYGEAVVTHVPRKADPS